VAISMLPKRHDPVLRFFESCKGYRQHEDRALRWLVSSVFALRWVMFKLLGVCDELSSV
jgi:hypothetical protein